MQLTQDMLDYSIEIHETLASSNNVVKRAIEEGVPEGLVVCAYEQTAGYGRLGRSWVSPQGGSYFSMLLRPEVRLAELPAISLLTGLAMRRALVRLVPEETGGRIAIKWPNDVVLAPEFEGEGVLRKGVFMKLCGISLERHAGATCIGVGTNVFQPFKQEDVGGKNNPTYVADLMGATLGKGIPLQVGPEGLVAGQRRLIMSVCSSFLHEFQPLYDEWLIEGVAPIIDDYNQGMCLHHRLVQMVNQVDQRIVSGVVQGVDVQGRLLLKDESGASLAVSSGEVSLL